MRSLSSGARLCFKATQNRGLKLKDNKLDGTLAPNSQYFSLKERRYLESVSVHLFLNSVSVSRWAYLKTSVQKLLPMV